MANTHSTLTGLFTDIADAIREKTGSTEPIVADQFPENIAAIDTQENLDAEMTTQDDVIAQILTALDGKITGRGQLEEQVTDLEAQVASLNAQVAELNESWAGTLTFSGTYNTSAYYTAAGCSLAVDKQKGMAFVTIQGGTSTSYEKIYFTAESLPSGVTMQSYNQYFYGSTGNTKDYYTVGLTGITGKINVAVNFKSINSSYDYTEAALTVTYA